MVLKGILILGIVIAFSVFFGTGLHHELTLAAVKYHQLELQQLYAGSPWLVVGGFLACYLPVIILNLPGAAVLGLVAGSIFGTLAGTMLVSFAGTIGATMACALSRYLFRDMVQRRFADKLKRVNAGLHDEGALYLFSLRLLPVIPFFYHQPGHGADNTSFDHFLLGFATRHAAGNIPFCQCRQPIGTDRFSGWNLIARFAGRFWSHRSFPAHSQTPACLAEKYTTKEPTTATGEKQTIGASGSYIQSANRN